MQLKKHTHIFEGARELPRQLEPMEPRTWREGKHIGGEPNPTLHTTFLVKAFAYC